MDPLRGHKRRILMVLLVVVLEEANSYNDECYVEKGRGLRIRSSYVDQYEEAWSLRGCEEKCTESRYACRSFSYSKYHTREKENCLLSREDSNTLDLRDERDFYRDSDFDYYELARGRECDDNDDYYYRDDRLAKISETNERQQPLQNFRIFFG